MKKSNVMTKLECMVFVLLVFCFVQVFAADCGDVNGDEGVDILDALLIAQDYVGLNPANYDPSVADVNADGSIDIVDALLVAQFYVGLIGELPGCGPGETPVPIPPGGTGEILYQYWLGLGDTNPVSDLTSSPDFPDNPSGSDFLTSFQAPTDWEEQFGSRIVGYLYPSVSGVYYFWIASDDHSELWLSTTSSENDEVLIAYLEGHCDPGEYDVDSSQASGGINLIAGSIYYIEALHKESHGGDNLEVAWQPPGGSQEVIPGSYLSPYQPGPTETPTPTPTPTPPPTPTPTCDGTCPPRPSYLPKHWHETNGFGTSTTGGIGGSVYKVTNLNSSGSGSLRDAVSGSNRLVVFEVGGVIDLGGSRLSVGSDITIAGQTAPYPGITTIRANFRINGSNIVVSHITHMMGDDVGGHPDAMNVQGSNIVLDHVAVYWGKDETLPVAKSNNVTLYKCLVAEGLQFTGHEDGEHSKGLHLQEGDSKISVISGLQVHSALRNPRLDGGEAFLANWVLYNNGPGWDHRGSKVYSDDELADCPQCYNYGISPHMNADITVVGCVGLQGPETLAEYLVNAHYGDDGDKAYAYMEDNIMKDREGNDLYMADSAIVLVDSPEIWPEGVEYLPAHEALYEVLRTAGPHPGQRNAHNARVVKDVADGTGEIIDSEDEVGGYPNYPSTSRALGEIPAGAEARQAWLDELEDEIAVDTSIDLSRLYNMVGSADSDIITP